MKIGRGVSELWRVENRPLPLTWPMAYTTACTTVQAVMTSVQFRVCITRVSCGQPLAVTRTRSILARMPDRTVMFPFQSTAELPAVMEGLQNDGRSKF